MSQVAGNFLNVVWSAFTGQPPPPPTIVVLDFFHAEELVSIARDTTNQYEQVEQPG